MFNAADQHRIVVSNMPVDTGTMRRFGSTTVDMGHYIKTTYHINVYPYIVYQEEQPGKNQYFIRNNTVGEINATIAAPNNQSPTNSLSKPYANDNLVRLGVTQKLTNTMR
jgi:hypothetical protein